MHCFPCFTSKKSKKNHSRVEHGFTPERNLLSTTHDNKKQKPDEVVQFDPTNIKAQTFTFRELASVTKNFRQECLLGEGGFGRVYKATLPATGQVVAVKQLDRNGLQGNKEFLVEVLMLSLLHHENLINLIGYCADGDQRLLVYEFLSGGSLDEHLLESGLDKPPLDWFTRMKIASGAARGLEYLHDKANPPVIYRDLKSSNILLDDDLNPKLSDFGLAKLAGGNKTNPAPSRIMGTYGYSAPEYVRTGQLTLKSDVYSFGVILLELITGRRAIDTTKPNDEQNLVSWAQPLFRDPKRFPYMADPLLNKHFPEKDLNQAVAIAAMCLQEEAAARPLMSDVVTALSFLSMVPPDVISASLPHATSPSEDSESEAEIRKQSRRLARSHDEDGEGSSDAQENEKQHGSDIQTKEFYSKSSRKSSKRSRNRRISSSRRNSFSSEDGSVSSSPRSRNESRQKSSRKSHGQKSSRSKCSSRVSSHKTSKESADGVISNEQSESFGGNSSGASEDSFERGHNRDISFGLISNGGSGGGSVHSEEGNGQRIHHTSSRGSDKGR